jgi:hypothetical protein
MLDWPATNKVLDGVDEVSRLTTVRSKGGTAMVDQVVPRKRPPKGQVRGRNVAPVNSWLIGSIA